MRIIRSFWNSENGATSIEYALIAGFVSLAIVVSATAIGTSLSARFFSVSNGLT